MAKSKPSAPSKRGAELIRRMKHRARTKPTGRLGTASPKLQAWEAFSISVYRDEANWLSDLAALLKERTQIPRMNRSKIIQQAVRCLARELDPKNSEEIAAWFVEREGEQLGGREPLAGPGRSGR